MEVSAIDLVHDAVTELVTVATFFGSLCLSLRLVEDGATARGTCATDATHLFYDPEWMRAQALRVRMTAMAHEALHCGLLHCFRLEGRDLDLANEAADHVVNLALANEKWAQFWDGALMDPRFAGMSFEQVYAILKHERDQQRAQQPPPPSPPAPQDDCDEDEQDDGPTPDDTRLPEWDDDQEDDSDDESDESAEDQAGPAAGEAAADGEDEDDAGDGADTDVGADGEGDDAGAAGGGGDADSAGDAGGAAPVAKQPGGILPPPPKPTKGGEDGAEDGARGQDGQGQQGNGAADDGPMSETDWTMAVSAAQVVANKRGQISAGVDELVRESRKEAADWRAALWEWFEQQVPSDYSWQRPNRRYIAGGLYLPGTVKENLPPVVVAMDRSGSQFSPEIMGRFANESTAILRELRPEWLEVVYFDSAVLRTERFEPDDQIEFHPCGGGGTAFQPVLDYCNAMDEPPCGVIFLTDLLGENVSGYGPQEPDFPVLWVTDETSTIPAPFGSRLTLPEVDR